MNVGWPNSSIASTYHAWRGTDRDPMYENEPGFCYSAELAEIKEHDYVLTPGRYAGSPEAEEDGEPIAEKIDRLTKDLNSYFDESSRLENEIRNCLGMLDA